MIILTGKNLNERHKQLNEKVNDAAKEKNDFYIIKQQPETSDVDKIFKIDLAAKYRNVEYILDILKCGDALYISRAINKCTWMYDNDFGHIINDDYLAHNIFPFMSIKKRNKLLVAIAANMDDGARAVGFYSYCMKIKLHNVALKFLINTPETFRMDVIIKKSKGFRLITEKEGDYLVHFIGDSFPLAETYVKHLEYDRQKVDAIYLLRYMYSFSNEKYLTLLEKCDVVCKVFGRRLSNHILHNCKTRVMKKPFLYATILNKYIISRNCSVEDAKIFAVALLPEQSTQFFECNFYANHKLILDLIPAEEKFSFIKKIFTDKYPDVAFETCLEFYSYSFYNMMTIKERETWALNNLASRDEILGSGKDYLWCKFINFEKSLATVKKFIMKTTDNDIRLDMLNILIESAKTEEDLIKLLNYFSERHMNEVGYIKNNFVDKLINDHKVLRFGESCWLAFEKVFYSLEVFEKSRYLLCDGNNYKVLALVYYIIHKKPVLKVLNEYIEMSAVSLYALKNYDKDLVESEKEMVFQYIVSRYTEKIKALSKTSHERDTKKEITSILLSALDLAQHYDKTKADIPEVMQKYIELDWDNFSHHSLLTRNVKFSSSDITHYLKKDAELIISEFPKIKHYIKYSGGNINWLVNKVKIYFAHDVSKKYLSLFNEWLIEENLSYTEADVIVRGIFIMADDSFKIALMDKFKLKEDKKRDYNDKSNKYYVQRAICGYMHCSRPPLPLSKVMEYVAGDYVQHCLTLFRAYMLNLPYPRCLEFVESMIDKPVSIQKHGLRLAFECFDEEKLATMVIDCWKKTKNVSLRMVLYQSLFIRVLHENDDAQLKLFEVLIKITSDLNEDDDDEIFKLTCSKDLPDLLIGRYLEALWYTLQNINKFHDSSKNFERMTNILRFIEQHKQNVFPEDALDKIIDSHINNMLDKRQILKTKNKQGYDDLLRAKWDLTISNLVYVANGKRVEKNLKVIKHIIKKCVELWDTPDDSNNIHVIRYFFTYFIKSLDSKSYDHDETSYGNAIIIFQSLKEELIRNFQEKQIYILCWNIDSSIVTKRAVMKSKEYIPTTQNQETDSGIRTSIVLFGSEFGNVIERYILREQMYSLFYEQIANIATDIISKFFNCIETNQLSLNDFYVIFCLGLLKIHAFETHMIATKLLPTEYEDKYRNDYKEVMEKIRAFPNKELQCFIYEKFGY